MTLPSPMNLRTLSRSSVVRILGSLKLAMLLLLALIVACIVGTIAESRLDAIVAQAYIYDAPWFVAWLIVLCANLICSVLARYPWKRHQFGFAITHAGIVILLAGAMIGRIWGIEGHVTLYKDAPVQNTLIVNETVLRVQSENMPAPVSHPIDTRLHPPTAKRPVSWNVNGIKVVVQDYSERLSWQTVVEEEATTGAPAVHVKLQSPLVPQPIEKWLWAGDLEHSRIAFGPAILALSAEAVALPLEQGAIEPASSEVDRAGSREKHFVFARMPEMNVAKPLSGPASECTATLRLVDSPANAKAVLEVGLEGQSFSLELDNAAKDALPLAGTSWSIEHLRYLPDFRMRGKEPVTVSDQPNNPAVIFDLVSSSSAADGCAKHEDACGGDHAPKKSCCPASKPGLTLPSQGSGLNLVYHSNGTLSYVSYSNAEKLGEGELKNGVVTPTGLGGWTVTVDKMIAQAVVRQELGPTINQDGAEDLRSGVLVQLNAGHETMRRWLGPGAPGEFVIGSQRVIASFGYRTQPLGFGVALDQFEVERNEGTDTPAGFKSHVSFVDPISKATVKRDVWMNHPASFPEFTGSILLGTSYKFSQASWNPDDLNQTTLQVLRDPGWSMKWIGSVLLCFGLFAMFYLKPSSPKQIS